LSTGDRGTPLLRSISILVATAQSLKVLHEAFRMALDSDDHGMSSGTARAGSGHGDNRTSRGGGFPGRRSHSALRLACPPVSHARSSSSVMVFSRVLVQAKESSKNNPLFFAGSDSKKGWAKPTIFWREKQRNPRAGMGVRCFYLGLKVGFAHLQTQTNPAKSRGLLFDEY
jgi:hypothetical protein